MSEPNLLLDTFAWAVRRMRDLQRTFETSGDVGFGRLMRAAEEEVDQLAALHTLPPVTTDLPPLMLDVPHTPLHSVVTIPEHQEVGFVASRGNSSLRFNGDAAFLPSLQEDMEEMFFDLYPMGLPAPPADQEHVPSDGESEWGEPTPPAGPDRKGVTT